jgi:hypothetical protein
MADRRDVTATHLTAASGYRMSLNKAFTIEIDEALTTRGSAYWQIFRRRRGKFRGSLSHVGIGDFSLSIGSFSVGVRTQRIPTDDKLVIGMLSVLRTLIIELDKVGADAEENVLTIVDNFAGAGMFPGRGAASEERALLEQGYTKTGVGEGAGSGESGQASSGDRHRSKTSSERSGPPSVLPASAIAPYLQSSSTRRPVSGPSPN